MKKALNIIFLSAVIFFGFHQPSEARKYVMNITPAQEICTKGQAISKGDVLNFVVSKDTYIEDQLFLSKGTPVSATVGYAEGDAWVGETPLLVLSYFETKDVTGDPVVVEYPLKIKGKYGLSKFSEYAKYYVKSIIYTANLELKPDVHEFNVLFER